MFKLRTLLESLHFPLWIIKDFAWFLGWGWVSLIFAIPTILISLILIGYTSGIKRIENVIVWCWLSGNTFWMVHELFLVSTKNIAIGLFVIGLGLSLKILPQIVRKFIND
jgi:hypothetical protein